MAERGGGFGSGFRDGGRGRGGPRGRGLRGRGRGREERGGGRGGRGRGGRGDRGRGGRGRGERGSKDEWTPMTKLGRLVKEGKFPSIQDIYLYSIKIKEVEIIDHYFNEEAGTELKDEIMGIQPVQRQTAAGQRTRFKAWVVVGDNKSHVGLGARCAAEVGIAIRGAHIMAKLSLVPIRKGYWGLKIGPPHTLPCKISGKCGSSRIRLIPAPRGTGLVAAAPTKKLLQLAGITDIYSRSCGETRTTGNFVTACYLALRKSFKILTPDLWINTQIEQNPLDKFLVKDEEK